jgi:trypsin
MIRNLTFFLALLLIVSCGVHENSNLDIVNGEKVYRSFYGRFEVGGGFRCGSSLIDKRWALTARHCIPGKHIDKIKIRFGAYDMRSGNNGGKPFDLVAVKRVIKHKNLDLALLQLVRPAKFRPVGFANKSFPNGQRLKAFGMGNNSWGVPNRPMILRGVVLKNVNRKNGNPNIIYTQAGNKGICHGDSGGPLMWNGKLVGVTSWTGSRCSTKQGVDGFVKPDYRWIKNNI